MFNTPVEKLGGLSTDATMTLHTRLAASLWYGRQEDRRNNVYSIVGMTRFARQVAEVWRESALDNPVADWVLISIEERYEVAAKTIGDNLEAARRLMDEGMVFDHVSDAVSTKPLTVELNFHNQWSYRMAMLLKKYDDIIRICLTAKHIGIFSDEDWKRLVLDSGSRFRSVTGAVTRDPGVHLERSWFGDYSSGERVERDKRLKKARRKISKLGKKMPYIPREVFKGELRPKFAPRILTAEERVQREQLAEMRRQEQLFAAKKTSSYASASKYLHILGQVQSIPDLDPPPEAGSEGTTKETEK